MDGAQEQAIRGYRDRIAQMYRTGVTTEHSFRGDLQSLLDALLPQYKAVNEPQRSECGAPDYALVGRRDREPHAYVEAKDLFDSDLRGVNAKGHKEQFDRYKAALSRVAFTDYLEFHFFADAAPVKAVRLLSPNQRGGFDVCNAEEFVAALSEWADCAIQRVTTAKRLAEIMARKARLLADAIRQTLSSDSPGAVKGQFDAFRAVLLHDLTPEAFADLYAQTIAYGMFAARLNDPTPEDFSRMEAAQLIPLSNPFLRKIFQSIATFDLDGRIAWIVDDLANAFAATDVDRIMGRYGASSLHHDPLIHFYEDFLAAYDPTLRKSCGVYYTPQSVVGFIVRAVDGLLVRAFGLSDGLADDSKVERGFRGKGDFGGTGILPVQNGRDARSTRLLHRVQILDPATGTGTFLAEAVRRIRERFAGNEGMWPEYVEESLRPRLHGFELLMAPYTITHLKLDMMLGGSRLSRPQSRLKVYLTNSLEECHPDTGTLFAQWLSEESTEANEIKRDCPVMVMVGNPPYSVSSGNKSEWIQKLIEDYKKGLNERKLNLDDDYIKFIRLGQYYIDRNGEGILAYISNNSFIDGITHRQMRKLLMESFDEIYILDLHGNARKKETAPDGSKDENVFDIMQGVSINIFVKRRTSPTETQRHRGGKTPCLCASVGGENLARVFHAEVYGTRKAKNEFLETHDLANAGFKELHPAAPYYFFVPKDFARQEEYEKGIKIDELFEINSQGIESQRDSVNIFFTVAEADEALSDFRNCLPEGLRTKYHVKDGRDWKLSEAQMDLQTNEVIVRDINYKVFDFRYVNYTGKSGICAYPRYHVLKNFIRENFGLLLLRQSRNGSVSNVFVTDKIVSKDTLSSLDRCVVFPLYLYDEQGNRTVNMKPEILEKFVEGVRRETRDESKTSDARRDGASHVSCLTPETIFAYIYAALHSPTYRERYREFLKIDFPRIPLPKDAAEFQRLAALGQRLIDLHLMRDDATVGAGLRPARKADAVCGLAGVLPLPSYPVPGTNVADGVRFDSGKVWINDAQYFDNVPEEAWNFYIGGYQPAQKWLKDRKGRRLGLADIRHYQRIISTLISTAALMREIG